MKNKRRYLKVEVQIIEAERYEEVMAFVVDPETTRLLKGRDAQLSQPDLQVALQACEVTERKFAAILDRESGGASTYRLIVLPDQQNQGESIHLAVGYSADLLKPY